MTDKITTTDLSDFGNIEKEEAGKLLIAMNNGELPGDFEENEVVVMFNLYSGNVFLTNSEFQVAMFNGDKLELFYSCSYCGHEGFLEDIDHEPEDKECLEFLHVVGAVQDEDHD